jgi:hypothetical protein
LEPEHQRRWANLNAFIAQLTQASDIFYEPPNDKLHALDKSVHGMWTMLKAFEDEEHPPETLVNTSSMRGACMWFIYASDRLWEHIQLGRTYSSPSSKTSLKGKDWDGFGRERWDFWVQGLENAKAAGTGDDEMKKLLDDAVASVKRAMAKG